MTDNSPDTLAPLSARPPRFDMYGPIHKALRRSMASVLTRMGVVDFDDPSGGAGAVLEELEGLLAFSEAHIRHEDAFVRGALLERCPSVVPSLDDDHVEHARLVAELRALAAALVSARPEHRREVGRALYLQLGALVADTLVHMNEEERLVQGLLERHFTDAELVAIQERLLASIAPPEMLDTLARMLPAVSHPERVAILTGARASAPEEAFAVVRALARDVLGDDELRAVEEAMTAASPAAANAA